MSDAATPSVDQAVFNNYLAAARVARNDGYPINVVAAAGQACHETGFGQYVPRGSNNVLGIKVGSGWTGPAVNAQTFEYSPGGERNDIYAWFRAYPDVASCFEDYGQIIESLWWYEDAAKLADADPLSYLTALKPIYGPDGKEVKEPGYFTDPNYVGAVMKIVSRYGPKPEDLSFEERYPALHGVDQLWINNELYGKVELARQVNHKLYVSLQKSEAQPSGLRGLILRLFSWLKGGKI